MLPFLKRNQEGSASGAVESIKREPDDGADAYDPVHSAAEDLISAIHSKDVSAVAEALKAAFALLDSEPHDEGNI